MESITSKKKFKELGLLDSETKSYWVHLLNHKLLIGIFAKGIKVRSSSGTLIISSEDTKGNKVQKKKKKKKKLKMADSKNTKRRPRRELVEKWDKWVGEG